MVFFHWHISTSFKTTRWLIIYTICVFEKCTYPSDLTLLFMIFQAQRRMAIILLMMHITMHCNDHNWMLRHTSLLQFLCEQRHFYRRQRKTYFNEFCFHLVVDDIMHLHFVCFCIEWHLNTSAVSLSSLYQKSGVVHLLCFWTKVRSGLFNSKKVHPIAPIQHFISGWTWNSQKIMDLRLSSDHISHRISQTNEWMSDKLLCQRCQCI